jgi:hypothetical protein
LGSSPQDPLSDISIQNQTMNLLFPLVVRHPQIGYFNLGLVLDLFNFEDIGKFSWTSVGKVVSGRESCFGEAQWVLVWTWMDCEG